MTTRSPRPSASWPLPTKTSGAPSPRLPGVLQARRIRGSRLARLGLVHGSTTSARPWQRLTTSKLSAAPPPPVLLALHRHLHIFLDDLFTTPAARGRGVGRSLIGRLTDMATAPSPSGEMDDRRGQPPGAGRSQRPRHSNRLGDLRRRADPTMMPLYLPVVPLCRQVAAYGSAIR